MTKQPLFETFRAAEELANLVDQHLAGVDGDAPSAAGLREATAFIMLHLVEGFPRMGMGQPLASLGKAREHLLRLQGLVCALPRQTGADAAVPSALERGVERVVTKLAFTMSWMDAGQSAPAADDRTRRGRMPTPVNLTAGCPPA